MNQRLDKDLVADTSICNLLLRISPARLDVAVYSVVNDNSFIYRSFPLESATQSGMSMLEEAIYDNPLLLGTFRRSYCTIQPDHVMAAPTAMLQGGMTPERLLRAQWPDGNYESMTSEAEPTDATFAYCMDPALGGFLRRTFSPDMRTDCHLAVLTRYFAMRPGRSNSVRTIANLREGSMDLLALRGQQLLMANTFRFDKKMDALYYILASRESLGLDPKVDEMLLTGNQPLREELSPLLRRYLARVMPVIFPPQMFKAGMDTLSAPFDMIVTPLCE
ncbi:MAG: DUF3822 family protein [Muribaculaceae bacterium]|nr:DUF3822 family protein [Muribaculaceae bacterium]